MLIRTKQKLQKWLIRSIMLLAGVLLCYVNIHRLNNNIYSNYERAVDYGRVLENKEIIEPIIAAVFYQNTDKKKKDISTYFERADDYKGKNAKILIIPQQINDNTLPVIKKLYQEVNNNNIIKKIALLTTGNHYIKEHTNILHQIVPDADLQTFIFNISDISIENKIEKYLKENGALTVVLDDLNTNIDNNNSYALTEEILWLAQKYAYTINVFDAIDTQISDTAQKNYENLTTSALSNEIPTLKRQQRNLQRYVNQYKEPLIKYFEQNLSLGLEKETIWPAKNTQTYRLYDRGVVYIRFFGDNGKELFARAKVGNNKGIIVAIIELARKAARKINQPIKSYKIYLLTDFEELEQDNNFRLSNLENDDGVYIQYKDKKALMVPDERPQKSEDWLKFLFIRAGVPQDTMQSDIKLFKFKTVEIENEN